MERCNDTFRNQMHEFPFQLGVLNYRIIIASSYDWVMTSIDLELIETQLATKKRLATVDKLSIKTKIVTLHKTGNNNSLKVRRIMIRQAIRWLNPTCSCTVILITCKPYFNQLEVLFWARTKTNQGDLRSQSLVALPPFKALYKLDKLHYINCATVGPIQILR